MACESCLELNFSTCGDPITFELGLSALTDYTLTVENNNTGQNYIITLTSDADGSLVWPTDDQPETLFVPFNGPFTATIEDEDGAPVEFTYAYNEYECIEFSFIPTAQL
jgi:hypothetical protein